jgi:hypothetical protein
MKRKYNKNNIKKVQPEEKAYTKSELNKAKVEGWNRAIEALTEQINLLSIDGRFSFLGHSTARNEMKEQVLKTLKDNIYPV